jgi:hypothetical protein
MAHFRQGMGSGACPTTARSKPLLASATALTSPHLLGYDLVLLAPALAFLTAVIKDDGARDYDKSLMALIWIAPRLAAAWPASPASRSAFSRCSRCSR